MKIKVKTELKAICEGMSERESFVEEFKLKQKLYERV